MNLFPSFFFYPISNTPLIVEFVHPLMNFVSYKYDVKNLVLIIYMLYANVTDTIWMPSNDA